MSTRPRVTSAQPQLSVLATSAAPPRARVGADTFTVRPGETVVSLAQAVATRYRHVASQEFLVVALTSLFAERGLVDTSGTLRARAGEVVTLPSGSEVAARHAQQLRTGRLGDRMGTTTAKQSADLRRLVSPPAAATGPEAALAPRATGASMRDLEDLPLAPIPPPNPERIPLPLEPIPLPPRSERGRP